MSNIKAEVLLATRHTEKSKTGLVTIVLEVPYYVWVEFLTHRRISKNATSNRAMKMEKNVEMGYYIPDTFYTQGEGMASSRVPVENQLKAKETWQMVWGYSVSCFNGLTQLGVSREQASRVLPAFKMMKGIATATEDAWAKFLELRDNPLADVAMQEFAAKVKLAIENAQWNIHFQHVPYMTYDQGEPNYPWNVVVLECAARIARVSYDKAGSGKSDYELGKRLLKNKHMSCFDHIAIYRDEPDLSPLTCKQEDMSHLNDLGDGFLVPQGWETARCMIERGDYFG